MAGRAIGMHEKEQNDGDPLEGKIPKPIRNAARSVKSVGSAPGHTGNDKDLTQTPMEEILWKKANPKQIESILNTAPHIIGEIVDKWERFANAISPTPPFQKMTFLRINALLAPAFLMSLFVNYYMIYKGIGFAIGFGIFVAEPKLSPLDGARYDGKKGWLYITDNSILFSHKEQGNSSSLVVEIPFADIKQLKRATAFSVKAAEVAAHWGSGTELLGSVEIDGLNDKTWRFTALPERDELFNCLVAISGHR
ncbi:hypothetical protein ACMFMG_007840 [Clarireedia jacksonii]